METGDVSEVEKGVFGSVVDMGEEGESGVQDNSKVTACGGGGDGGAVNVEGEVSGVVWVRESGPVMRTSDLLELSLRKLCCIQVLMSVKQLERVERVEAVMVLEGR